MLKSIITTTLVLFSTGLFSQIDSTKYVTHDVVNLKEGGVLKGEIMSFDEPSGGLVFKDLKGRVYSLSREEYVYFQENQPFPIGKKEFTLKERKNNESALEVGFDLTMISLNQYFENDENILYQDYQFFDTPFSLKVSGGKYFDDKNFAGVTIEYAISAESQNIVGGGLRYKYMYDSKKNNTGLYIPVELKFISLKGNSEITFDDTTFYDTGGSSWPTSRKVETSLQAINLSLGHGFAFVTSNKKTISLEFSVQIYTGIKEKYTSVMEIFPDRKFKGTGFKGGISFEF